MSLTNPDGTPTHTTEGKFAPGCQLGPEGGKLTRFGQPNGPDPSESGKKGGSVSPTSALARRLTRQAAERIAEGLIQAAADGNVAAWNSITDRIDGPVALQMGEALKALTPQVVVVKGEYEPPELPKEVTVEHEPPPKPELGEGLESRGEDAT